MMNIEENRRILSQKNHEYNCVNFNHCTIENSLFEVVDTGSVKEGITRGENFEIYDFKAQKIARIICHYLCCPREGINPRELMPPFTILDCCCFKAARLFFHSPPKRRITT